MRARTLWRLTVAAVRSWRLLLARRPEGAPARAARARALADGFRPAYAEVPALPAAGPHPTDLVWVDVRSAAERAVSGLPGAVTAEEWSANPEPFAGRRPVAVCTLGVRAGAWAADRRAEGHDAVFLDGGLIAWAWAEGSLVAADGAPTRRLHVGARPWDLLPEGWEGVVGGR